MQKKKVTNLAEFRLWVKVRLVEKEISQRELAKQMEIPHTRISEAIHGKQSGNKYITSIIETLGGNVEDFKEFMEGNKL